MENNYEYEEVFFVYFFLISNYLNEVCKLNDDYLILIGILE